MALSRAHAAAIADDSRMATSCAERVVVNVLRMQTTTPARRGSAAGRVVTWGLESGEVTVRIEGALDALTIRDIRPTIDALVAGRPRHVTVDFERVTLLDSTGVGAIVSLFKRITAQGGRVVLVRAHDQPLAVLRLLKLDAVFGL